MNNKIEGERNNSHKNSSSKIKLKTVSNIYQPHKRYSLVSDEKERAEIRNRIVKNP